MNRQEMEKQFKDDLGFVPPGVTLSKHFGKEMQEIIADYHHEIWGGNGALELKYLYLVALGTAVFDDHERRAKLEARKAYDHGATLPEITEVLKQQIWMKGAPTIMKVAPVLQYIKAYAAQKEQEGAGDEAR